MQVVHQEYLVLDSDESTRSSEPTFRQEQPREKWLKRRTTIKLRVRNIECGQHCGHMEYLYKV